MAAHRYREKQEKAKLKAARANDIYSMDPLLETLMSHSTDQDLSSRLLALFEKFDIDEDKTINYQELYEGLYKLKFKPPITLSKQEFDFISRDYTQSTGGVDFIGFSSIMREQIKLFVQRRLGNFIDRFSVCMHMCTSRCWCCAHAGSGRLRHGP